MTINCLISVFAYTEFLSDWCLENNKIVKIDESLNSSFNDVRFSIETGIKTINHYRRLTINFQ